MNKYTALILSLFITGCTQERLVTIGDGPQGERGETGQTGLPGADGSSCSTTQTANGAIISCTDGSMVVILHGEAGQQGEQGATGPQGEQGATGPQGEQGATGPQGEQGQQGEIGPAGADAPPTAYTVTEIVDPCGDAPGTHDEVLLRLHNGQVMAHFASGAKQFLSIIGPGSYVTTDGTGCHFSIDANGDIHD